MIGHIDGFTAAPPGWRVVWICLDGEPPAMVTAPIAGWIHGTEHGTGDQVIVAATHCPSVMAGQAPSSPWLYPVSEALEPPSGVWKILAPGEPLPALEEAEAEARGREASWRSAQRTVRHLVPPWESQQAPDGAA